MLFKSEGGAIHHWFTRAVNFSVINYFLVYWMTDILILRGTLDTNTAVSADWNKLAALFFLQIVSTFIQIGSKGSLDFDYKLATAVPTDFVPSVYVPEIEEDVVYEEPAGLPEGFSEFDNEFTQGRQNTGNESDIENYWGF